jgi:hypothetical protein
MSHQLIDRSPDLKQLRDEGYDVEIIDGYLILREVPYVTTQRQIQRGILISKLTLANDTTTTPDDHVMHFAGVYPCHRDGSPIERIRNGDAAIQIGGGIVANYTFSAKPQPSGRYENYYTKMTTYVAILAGPAEAIDPAVTARTFRVVRAREGESVFRYIDTASSRAEIGAITKKLRLGKIAIIGLGGTGSYVLDLVAKTPVAEIHLVDGDIFLQHNAFRSPGAASGDELDEKLPKVAYFERIYSKMRHGIVAHPVFMSAENLDLLQGMDFVFLCMGGGTKKLVVRKLEELGTPFVDVGMGLYLSHESLGGVLRTTTSTPQKRDHVWSINRIPFSENDEKNEYDKNIQIADLNALNAAIAVIRWKKLYKFYIDQEQEHFSTYTIGGNDINNEDHA